MTIKNKIQNIDDLRDHAVKTLEELAAGDITIEQAGATSKLCENVVSTLKLQVEIAKMTSRLPSIPFLGNYKTWEEVPKKVEYIKKEE